MNRERLFELAGKSGGRTTRKIKSEVPILIMSDDALETFAAAVLVEMGEPMRVSASRVVARHYDELPGGMAEGMR